MFSIKNPLYLKTPSIPKSKMSEAASASISMNTHTGSPQA